MTTFKVWLRPASSVTLWVEADDAETACRNAERTAQETQGDVYRAEHVEQSSES